jgi:hypothetical protein
MSIDGEICCADRPIGAFGVVILGDLSFVWSDDVWSEVDKSGKRFIDNPHYKIEDGESVIMQLASGYEVAGIKNPSDSEALEFMQERAFGRYYCESWVEPIAITALWVKDWAKESTKKTAKLLAKNRGVPLLNVDGTTRIWDINFTPRFYTATGTY